MEPLKVVIFIVAFLLLLVLGRLLSSRAEVHASELPYLPGPDAAPLPQPTPIHSAKLGVAHAQYEPNWNNLPAAPDSVGRRNIARTGAEMGFPFSLPPVKQDEQGKFNRPYYLNYYFRHLDLVDGPADPTCFCDHFFMVYQDPATKHTWEREYMVATPSGLRDVMQKERFESLYLDELTIIVREWNLSLILRTVLDEHLKSFGSEDDEASQTGMPTVI
jgi:hypothetical protein